MWELSCYAGCTFLKFRLNFMDIMTFSEKLARRIDLSVKTTPNAKIAEIGEMLGAPKHSSGSNKRDYYSRLLHNIRRGKIHLQELAIIAKYLDMSWLALLFGHQDEGNSIPVGIQDYFANIEGKLGKVLELLHHEKQAL